MSSLALFWTQLSLLNDKASWCELKSSPLSLSHLHMRAASHFPSTSLGCCCCCSAADRYKWRTASSSLCVASTASTSIYVSHSRGLRRPPATKLTPPDCATLYTPVLFVGIKPTQKKKIFLKLQVKKKIYLINVDVYSSNISIYDRLIRIIISWLMSTRVPVIIPLMELSTLPDRLGYTLW